MNWIDPQVTLPEEGKIYLVLWEFNNTKLVGLASAGYLRRYSSKTQKMEVRKDKGMVWQSLYSQARTKAATFNGEMTSEYKMLERKDPRPDAFIELIPNDYPVIQAIAYISIANIDYPEVLIKFHSVCSCQK